MWPESEAWLRLSSFLAILVVMTILETLFPRRTQTQSRSRRAFCNLTLAAVNTLLLRLLPILSAVGVAWWAQEEEIGLFHTIDAPIWLKVVSTIVLLDLLIYGQHVASHYWPILWRFHRVHHADRDLDATSGLRFHTGEIIYSMIIKCLAVLLLGAPPFAVVLFEVILNATSIFNHSNVRLPRSLDHVVRLFIVTPDMHRVHHSVIRREANRNFGFNLSLWDHLFATYLDQPSNAHQTMPLGLPDEPVSPEPETLRRILAMPFQRLEPSPKIEASQKVKQSRARAS